MRCWAGDGLSMAEIARKIGVEKATLYLWIDKYPEVKTALYTTREQVDYEVENALFRRAVGYLHFEHREHTKGVDHISRAAAGAAFAYFLSDLIVRNGFTSEFSHILGRII